MNEPNTVTDGVITPSAPSTLALAFAAIAELFEKIEKLEAEIATLREAA